jgi:large subunit ribosomal protein L25
VEVFADPDHVPAFFEADLGALDIAANIRWHDLKGTEAVRPTAKEHDFVVATIAPPTKAQEVAADPAAAAAAPAAGKGKAPAKGAAPAKAAAAPAAKAPAKKK